MKVFSPPPRPARGAEVTGCEDSTTGRVLRSTDMETINQFQERFEIRRNT